MKLAAEENSGLVGVGLSHNVFGSRGMNRVGLVAFLTALLATASPGFAVSDPSPQEKTGVSKAEDPLSLEDLGFSKEDTQSDPEFQKELETRSDMLRIHQTLGLITAVPMTTELVLGIVTAGNVSNGNKDTTLHATLGLATAALYGTTALFEILAPKPKGLKHSGNTEVHEALSWIHLPLMVVVPLMGDMVNDRIANNQPIGNLGVVHGVLATTLVASYLGSLTIMTF